MNNILVAGAMTILNALSPSQVIEYTRHVPVYAQEFIETIEEKANRIAQEHGIATTSLANLIQSESGWNPKSDNGYDRGLVQINRQAWPKITDEQAFDPDFSLHFASEKIANGEGYFWVAGNCYLFVKAILGNLPKMSQIYPNTTIPRKGEIAIFYYKGKKHIGVEDEILENGFFIRESNYIPFLIGRRFIKWNDKNFAGFFSPDIASSVD